MLYVVQYPHAIAVVADVVADVEQFVARECYKTLSVVCKRYKRLSLKCTNFSAQLERQQTCRFSFDDDDHVETCFFQ